LTTPCYTIANGKWSKGFLEEFLENFKWIEEGTLEDSLSKASWTLWTSYAGKIGIYTSYEQEGYFFDIDLCEACISVFIREFPDLLYFLRELNIPYSDIGFSVYRRIGEIGCIDVGGTGILKITPLDSDSLLFESYNPIFTIAEVREHNNILKKTKRAE